MSLVTPGSHVGEVSSRVDALAHDPSDVTRWLKSGQEGLHQLEEVVERIHPHAEMQVGAIALGAEQDFGGVPEI